MKLTQAQIVLDELNKRDLSVREMVVDLWVNSPTKIISELRKTHKITDKQVGKYLVYHLEKENA